MKRIFFFFFISTIAATSLAAQSFNKAKLDSLFDLIEKNGRGMGSISLFKDGKEIYNRAYGYSNVEAKLQNNATTKFRIGSISKTFTAVIIMKLIEEGKLSLDTKLNTFYPELENADKITIQNLLQHRSGIYNLTNAADYETEWSTKYFSKEALLKKIASVKNVFAPDEKSEYSNSNYILLTFIAEDITKKSYGDLLQEMIIQPLGMNHTFLGKKINGNNNEAFSYTKSYSKSWVIHPETDMSIPLGAGAVVSTPQDLNTFFYAFMNGKIISTSSVEQMKKLKDNVGLGLFPRPFYNKTSYGHNGGIDGFQSQASYFADDQLNIAIVNNGVVFPINSIGAGVLNIYFNRPYSLPVFSDPIVLTDSELEPYTGIYSSASFPLKITITKKEGALVAQATGQSAFSLECYEKNKFKFDAAGLKLLFNPSENKMTLQQGGREFILTKE